MAPGSKINRPKIEKLKNPRKFKRQMKAQRKRQLGGLRMAEVQDKEIMPVSHLLKRRTSPKANITLSGKKKRKILNQLRRTQKDKEGMDFEIQKPSPKPRQTKLDVEMKTVNIPQDTRQVIHQDTQQDSEQDVDMKE